jgi:tetratricopeptide (TPR) repeat protein
MRRWGLIFLSAFFLLTARSQIHRTDSLLHVLATAKGDTNKVHLLLTLSEEYQHSHPDSALLYARQALKLTRALSYRKGEAKGLNILALGYLFANNRPKAFENHLKALKIYEELNDESGIAFSQHNIGLAYLDQGEYQLALNYLHRSKAINERQHNEPYLLDNLLILGGVFEQLSRFDSTLYYVNKAYGLALKLNDREKMGMVARILGATHAKMGQHALAMEFYRLSLPLHRAAGNDFGISNSTMGMAKLFGAAGQTDSALYYARLSLAAARKGGFPQLVLNASTFLTDYFHSIRQIDSAFVYQQIAVNIKDTLNSQDKIKTLQQLTYSEQERQHELEQQRAEEARQRTVKLQVFAIALIIPLFFLLFVFLSRRNIHLKTIELLGRISLLLLFEFIALFIHPFAARWTHHSPVLMLLILVAVGAILVPLHKRAEHWIEARALKKHLIPANEVEKATMTVAAEDLPLAKENRSKDAAV